jgi:thiazole synthase
MKDEKLIIAGKEFKSRLMVGTGKYADNETMVKALEASGTEIVTVAMGRVDFDDKDNILNHVDLDRYTLLPNTAGAFSVEDALRIARMSKAAGYTNWIKLEVLADKETLLPDMEGTIEAAKILVDEGFVVLPYINDDPIAAKKLEEIGCATVMPLASMIGSGHGCIDLSGIRIIVSRAKVPVVVDAGLGVPSDAALAMETGADAVLVNTAIAKAQDPILMAKGFKKGVKAGRLGHLAGRIPKKVYASDSSPGAGFE